MNQLCQLRHCATNCEERTQLQALHSGHEATILHPRSVRKAIGRRHSSVAGLHQSERSRGGATGITARAKGRFADAPPERAPVSVLFPRHFRLCRVHGPREFVAFIHANGPFAPSPYSLPEKRRT
ncbi:hypothetical protein Trydic_g5892 [Trypoxylus dichotomus]